MLYALLCGRGPFDDKRTAAELILAHAIEQAAPPSAFAPHIPAELDAVILRALAKEPADRHADAAELIAALEPFARSAPSAHPPPEPVTTVAQNLEADDTERDAAPAMEAQRKSSADDPTYLATQREAARAPRAAASPAPAGRGTVRIVPRTIRMPSASDLLRPEPLHSGSDPPVRRHATHQPPRVRRGSPSIALLLALLAVVVAVVTIFLR